MVGPKQLTTKLRRKSLKPARFHFRSARPLLPLNARAREALPIPGALSSAERHIKSGFASQGYTSAHRNDKPNHDPYSIAWQSAHSYSDILYETAEGSPRSPSTGLIGAMPSARKPSSN